jgi:hypothetical protein
MKMAKWICLLFIVAAFNTSAQLPSNVTKLVGVWKYKQGSGFESWKKQGDELVGHAYRINNKTGDTSRVEDMLLRKPQKTLLYTTSTYNFVMDSLRVNTQNFVGEKRKMKFFNMAEHSPHAIEYSFGFWNKNKLKINIYHGPFDKPLTLTLYRVKE